jgi:membrane-bound serine protease (ClpP class)
LILLILGGLYFEMQTPGVGFPIIASITALILYLVPYYLNGVAENWEILLFFIGIIFIALEVFVIPGFGVFGVIGLFTSLSSLILIMLNNDMFDFTFVLSRDLIASSLSVFISVFSFGLLVLFGGIKLTDSEAFKNIALNETQETEKGYISKKYSDTLLNMNGKSFTVLRPSGKVIIDEKIYDASTSGEYIEKNKKIIVTNNEGSSLKVKKA